MRKEVAMAEFILHLVTVVLTALILVGVFSIVDGYRRKRNKVWPYRIVCEYMHYRYSYNKMDECIKELNKLGSEGWEIATCAGDDSFAAYLILKRETLQTTKANGK